MDEMKNFFYADYIRKLAKQFDDALEEIEVNHNFEYGSEFEVAICKVFRRVLPHKFGVCRGYVVDETGDRAGDDIIIFDRIRFPTLRSLGEGDFSVKEYVPIDAVYAYIEAKHTLDLTSKDESSLANACDQTSRVKALCSRRPPVSLQTLEHGLTFGPTLKVDVEHGWPTTRNPMFACIISRRVRSDRGIMTDPSKIHSVLMREKISLNSHTPDLIVVGRNNLIIPACKNHDTEALTISGFYLHGESTFVRYQAPEIALGVGLCCLLWAIDWIQLNRMPWQRIIANGLGKLPLATKSG